MKHKNMYYDNRYKYKLNMLEPGLIMMKIIGVLFVIGILFLGGRAALDFCNFIVFGRSRICCFVNLSSH